MVVHTVSWPCVNIRSINHSAQGALAYFVCLCVCEFGREWWLRWLLMLVHAENRRCSSKKRQSHYCSTCRSAGYGCAHRWAAAVASGCCDGIAMVATSVAWTARVSASGMTTHCCRCGIVVMGRNSDWRIKIATRHYTRTLTNWGVHWHVDGLLTETHNRTTHTQIKQLAAKNARYSLCHHHHHYHVCLISLSCWISYSCLCTVEIIVE